MGRQRLAGTVRAVAITLGIGIAAPALAADPGPSNAPPHDAAPVPQHAPSIQIVYALYGSPRSYKTCDAADVIKRMCQGRVRCAVPVGDDVCPAPETPPSVLIAGLSVRYHCFQGDKDRSATAQRPFTLRISCSTMAK